MIRKIEHTMAENIIGIVSDYYGIPKEKMFAKTRVWDVVRARQMACYMIRKYTNIPKLAIGRRYFGQDHSTVIHSLRVIEADVFTNVRGTKHDIVVLSQAIEEQQSIKISKAQYKYAVLVRFSGEPDLYFGPWEDAEIANRMLQNKVKPMIDMESCELANVIKVASIE